VVSAGAKTNLAGDATNRDIKRMRARIRKKLLPLLEKQFQPAIVAHLATLAELAREDEAFLDAMAEERVRAAVRENDGRTWIAVEELIQLRKKKESYGENAEGTEGAEKTQGKAALSKRMIRRIVESIKPLSGQLGAAHVEAVLQLARGGRNGSWLALPAA